MLAARVAERVSAVLDVEGSLVSASSGSERDGKAERVLASMAILAPELPGRVARVESARALVDDFEPDALLVVGAPGGSWLQRQFFGPGKQLIVGAPGGAVVVRSAPERCFQRMLEPDAMGVGMRVDDALRLIEGPVAPVVDDGLLVGIVRRKALKAADPSSLLGPLMEDPVFVHADDPVDAASELMEFLDHGAVPVVDGDGKLVGLV